VVSPIAISRELLGLILPFAIPLELTVVYTIEYSNKLRFEWDEHKNRSNFKKHGVWFEEAHTVWVDSESVEFLDPEHSSNEDRFIRVGHSTRGRILLVVFCERAEGSTIRIISARKATTQEMRDYEKGI
jgi:uncharacterized protein